MKKRSVLAMVMAMGMVMGLTVPASAAENYKIAWVDGTLQMSQMQSVQMLLKHTQKKIM